MATWRFAIKPGKFQSTPACERATLAVCRKRKQALFRRLFPLFGASPPEGFHRCSVDGLALDESIFVRLGFTDASIAATVGQQHLLLTDDLDLYLAAQAQGAPAINFTHMREAAGLL